MVWTGYCLVPVLSRHRWPRLWFRHRDRNRLPTFLLNLFIQAKRPQWSNRPSKVLREKGFAGLYWRFDINADQQKTLELVADKLKKRTLITYASPTFHQHQDLFRHTRTGSIADHSTFPSVGALKGHDSWYYNLRGASGIAHSVPEEIKELPLEQRIGQFVEGTQEWGYWSDNLKSLSVEILGAMSDGQLPETSRRASFFDAIKILDGELADVENAGVFRAFFTIQIFCEIYLVDWYVLGT